MEASNTSENPRSVICWPRDEVASTRRRRPCNADTQDLSMQTADNSADLRRSPCNEY